MDAFDQLIDQYPAIIAKMPDQFNAHRFILALARQHQSLYVRLLAQYVDNSHPFMTVHGRLAQALYRFDHLVENIGDELSEDIFRQSQNASLWRKK